MLYYTIRCFFCLFWNLGQRPVRSSLEARKTQSRMQIFIGPADGDHYNRILLSESSTCQ